MEGFVVGFCDLYKNVDGKLCSSRCDIILFKLMDFSAFYYHHIGSLGCWSHLEPITSRLRGLGDRGSLPTGQYNLKDAVYQDAGIYKCVGQSPNGKKKLEVLHTVSVGVRGECQM